MDSAIRSLTFNLAPQRYAEMYIKPKEENRQGLAEDEEHVDASDLSDVERYIQELDSKREMGADEAPLRQWGEWQ